MVKGETSWTVAATEAQRWSYDQVSYVLGKAWDTKFPKVSDFGPNPVQVVGFDDKI
jgi:hypothetical protein